MMLPTSNPPPWHRIPFVWLLILLPATSVLLGITLLILAVRSDDGLVVDDYYKQGKEINLSLERDRRAQTYGLAGEISLDSIHDTVHVALVAHSRKTLPHELVLRWLHATRAGFDHESRLTIQASGNYQTSLPTLAPGHWYVQLEGPDWRLRGSLHIPQDRHLALAPAR